MGYDLWRCVDAMDKCWRLQPLAPCQLRCCLVLLYLRHAENTATCQVCNGGCRGVITARVSISLKSCTVLSAIRVNVRNMAAFRPPRYTERYMCFDALLLLKLRKLLRAIPVYLD